MFDEEGRKVFYSETRSEHTNTLFLDREHLAHDGTGGRSSAGTREITRRGEIDRVSATISGRGRGCGRLFQTRTNRLRRRGRRCALVVDTCHCTDSKQDPRHHLCVHGRDRDKHKRHEGGEMDERNQEDRPLANKPRQKRDRHIVRARWDEERQQRVDAARFTPGIDHIHADGDDDGNEDVGAQQCCRVEQEEEGGSIGGTAVGGIARYRYEHQQERKDHGQHSNPRNGYTPERGGVVNAVDTRRPTPLPRCHLLPVQINGHGVPQEGSRDPRRPAACRWHRSGGRRCHKHHGPCKGHKHDETAKVGLGHVQVVAVGHRRPTERTKDCHV